MVLYIYTHMLVYTHIYIEICTDIDRDSHRAINKKTDIHTGIAIIFDIATETDIDIGTGTDIDIDIYIYLFICLENIDIDSCKLSICIYI